MKQKANISIEFYASNVTIGFDLHCDLELSRSNMEFPTSQPKMVRLPQNKEQTYQLNPTPQRWPSGLTLAMTLTLNFQGQVWNLLYLSPKWFDWHKIKSTHKDWTEGLSDHQVWPWPWPWKMRCKDLPDSDRSDFICGHTVDASSCACRCNFKIISVITTVLFWSFLETQYEWRNWRRKLQDQDFGAS